MQKRSSSGYNTTENGVEQSEPDIKMQSQLFISFEMEKLALHFYLMDSAFLSRRARSMA